MKPKIVFLFFFAVIVSFSTMSFAQLKTGLTINGSPIGNISNTIIGNDPLMTEIRELGGTLSTNYKCNVSLGYKFRIQPEKPFFYDLDLFLGLKQYDYNYFFSEVRLNDENREYTFVRRRDVQFHFYYTSLNFSFNYLLYKRIYVGCGMEPTLYLSDSESPKFDIPVTLQAGFNWDIIGIALNYKIGLANPLSNKDFASGNLNELQIQLFIPF